MDVINLFSAIHYDVEDIFITDLFQTKHTKEIAIALHAHQFMKEYESEYPLVLHVIQGSVKLIIGEDVVILVPGDILALEAKTKHRLEALEKTLLRVSISLGEL